MYIHMFCISASLSCPSHSIDICAVVIKKKSEICTLFQPINLQIFCILTITDMKQKGMEYLLIMIYNLEYCGTAS